MSPAASIEGATKVPKVRPVPPRRPKIGRWFAIVGPVAVTRAGRECHAYESHQLP